MNILLVDPARKFSEMKTDGSIKCFPSLGLIYIGSFLKQAGYDINYLDIQISKLTEDEIINYIKKINPDVVALTTMSFAMDDVFTFANLIKNIKPDAFIVCGGAHATAKPEELLTNPNIDFIVLNEGEYTFYHLIKQIEGSNYI